MLANFGFVIPEKLAGCAYPTSWDFTAREALAELAGRHKITAVVSLTTSAPEEKAFAELGLRRLHAPIQDMGVPSLSQADRIVDFALEEIENGGRVVVHCAAGRGRTGAMLACCLVARGCDPSQAIDTVRRQRPGSIETAGQEDFVRTYAAHRARR